MRPRWRARDGDFNTAVKWARYIAILILLFIWWRQSRCRRRAGHTHPLQLTAIRMDTLAATLSSISSISFWNSVDTSGFEWLLAIIFQGWRQRFNPGSSLKCARSQRAQMKQDELTRDEAARYLGVSKRTLEKWVETGTGPSYRRRGRRAFYTIADLDAWSDRHQLRRMAGEDQ